MTRREAIVSAAAIFGLAVAVRIVAAAAVPFAVPEDTAYYWGVARNAVEGRGLVSDALWSYYLPPLTLPRPAFEIWLPLPTFLSLPFLAVLGTTFRSAQVAGVLVSAIVPVLAWRLAADLAEERRLAPLRGRVLAVGSGIVAALYGPLVLYGALPDSTAPFTVAAVSACILMERVVRDPRGARLAYPRLLGIGLLLGLAALTRNEAAWYALAWVGVAWGATRAVAGEGARIRAYVRLLATPALAAIAVYVPWTIRQWAVFGTPLPGQALSNAYFRTGNDVFGWADKPTLGAWLAQGPAKLVSDRVDAFLHNTLAVLLIPALPVGPIGIVALPWFLRSVVLRPLLVGAALTFLATTLVFPVATLWGTFLHAGGPIHVLLVVSAMAGLDMLVAWVATRRGWGRGSALLAPAAVILFTIPMLFVTITGIGAVSTEAERRYRALLDTTTGAGIPLAENAPVIADFPIWLAETARVPALALPQESPADVLDLARTFGAKLLVVSVEPAHGEWPAILDAGGEAAGCFDLVPEATVRADDGSDAIRVYRIACP